MRSHNLGNIQIDIRNCEERLTTSNETIEKCGAVWTYNTTLTLLRLYENKLVMLESPKKKTRIWVAISESLRDYNIMMTSDQVRWKINALTKKYKQCLANREIIKFKYFEEMDKIYARYNVECNTFNYLNDLKSDVTNKTYLESKRESKTMIELRKVRLASRIESERSQSKINLEKQWLEYLKREEQNKLCQDEILEQKLKIQKGKFQWAQQKLIMKESLELRQLELKEREQNELLRIEREKVNCFSALLQKQNKV